MSGLAPSDITELQKAEEFLTKARIHREIAEEMENKAIECHKSFMKTVMRNNGDRLINKKEVLNLLPVNTYQSLTNYINQYSQFGYLRFHKKKILRSEVLRFLDDLQSGKIERLRRGHHA